MNRNGGESVGGGGGGENEVAKADEEASAQRMMHSNGENINLPLMQSVNLVLSDKPLALSISN
jgi:hypothetical protein